MCAYSLTMPSKTREKLIDVARRLFISKGVENTTISDIANASDKGRRTIYTYFKNKRDIYKAVIERESDKMVSATRAILMSGDSAEQKLRDYLELRATQFRTIATPNTSLRNLITMDYSRNAKTRRLAAEKEEAMLHEIIDQGIREGDFDPERGDMLKQSLYALVVAVEQMPETERSRLTPKFVESVIDFIVLGVKK
ncbi:MAG: TetR/AcrR family transcriptional regulator [Bacteroidales bacterium]|nr:TetR/AcrR family transcriptional regulator [Bacteroidales bacterium]